MGAWGAGPFENDNALDWLGDVSEATNPATEVESALQSIAEAEWYLGAPDCCNAQAVAEIVAAYFGAAPVTLPASARKLLDSKHFKFGAAHVSLALSALERILADSELKELWDKSGDEGWIAGVKDLQERLKRCSGV